MEENERNLLEALRRAAREEDVAADPRWSALAAGAISDKEEAELLAAAQGSEDARREYDAFRPLDADIRARMTERVLAQLNLPRQNRGPEGADRGVDPTPPPALRGASARPRPPPASASRRRRAHAGLLVAGVVAAAATLLLLARSGAPPPPLAAYALSVEGGERVERSPVVAPEDVRRLGPRSRLTITLRPERDVEGPVAARALLVREGRAHRWEPPIQVAKSGSVFIDGVKEALFAGVPQGAWDVVCVVGRPDALPDEGEILARAAKPDPRPGDPSEEPFRILRLRVLLTDAASENGP